MSFILLAIATLSFSAYFYAIWLQYFGLIPILALLIFLIYYFSGVSIKIKSWDIFQRYWLFFAWIVTILWIFLIWRFFDIAIVNMTLFLIILNISFWILSYIFKYDDGKIMWQVWYYGLLLFLLIYTRFSAGFGSFFIVFNMVWLLTFALLWFIIFVLKLKYKIEKYLLYQFFVFAIVAAWLVLYDQIDNIHIFLLVSVLWLSILYLYIYNILSHKPPSPQEFKNISVRRILAWERVLNQDSIRTKNSYKIYSFIDEFPKIIKYILEWFNVFIILLLIYLYFQNAISLQGSFQQIFYWLITLWFVSNVYLLKKIWYTSTIQRFVTFAVINFAIYISLFAALQSNIWRIVFFAIIRNIICGLIVFHVHKTKVWLYLKKVDYLFWIFTTLLALVVNIILLIHTQVIWQLLFPIILLYIWIQWMILFYSVKYINKIQEIDLTQDFDRSLNSEEDKN